MRRKAVSLVVVFLSLLATGLLVASVEAARWGRLTNTSLYGPLYEDEICRDGVRLARIWYAIPNRVDLSIWLGPMPVVGTPIATVTLSDTVHTQPISDSIYHYALRDVRWSPSLTAGSNIVVYPSGFTPVDDPYAPPADGFVANCTLLLAPPWQARDIPNSDSVGLMGSTVYSAGTYIVRGSGYDIYDYFDEFRFVHRPWSGDGEIIAQVMSMENTDPWAKAGVMFRETLGTDSRYVFMTLTNNIDSNGIAFQRRTAPGAHAEHTPGGLGGTPHWLRLVRSGTTFTGFASTDGANWRQIGSANVAMGSQIYVGMAVSSHNRAKLNRAVFDGMAVNTPTSTLTPTTPGVIATATPHVRLPLVIR